MNKSDAITADYIVEHVQVIAMKNYDVLYNRAVVINDGKIIKIINQSDLDKVTATQRIDGEGRYLMPGLADMHVHVRWNPQRMFDLFLINGVVTVVNMRLKDGGLIIMRCVKKSIPGKCVVPGIY